MMAMTIVVVVHVDGNVDGDDSLIMMMAI